MYLMARTREELEDMAEELERETDSAVVPMAVDATDDAEVARAFSSIGELDVLIYNAAVVTWGTPSELTPEKVLRDFDINVVGAVRAIGAVIQGMRRRERGTIMVTGGGFAREPVPHLASLGMGKAALRNLSQSLAKELEDNPVRVMTVTIDGMIERGTDFDPDRIAKVYWRLFADEGATDWEYVYQGN